MHKTPELQQKILHVPAAGACCVPETKHCTATSECCGDAECKGGYCTPQPPPHYPPHYPPPTTPPSTPPVPECPGHGDQCSADHPCCPGYICNGHECVPCPDGLACGACPKAKPSPKGNLKFCVEDLNSINESTGKAGQVCALIYLFHLIC